MSSGPSSASSGTRTVGSSTCGRCRTSGQLPMSISARSSLRRPIPRSLAAVSEGAQRRLVSPPGRRRLTRGAVPYAFMRVPGICCEVTYDTFENRFVRFVLDPLRQRARQISAAATRAKRPDLSAEADALAVRFAAPLRREPLAFVGRLLVLPNVTQAVLRGCLQRPAPYLSRVPADVRCRLGRAPPPPGEPRCRDPL